jgi:hypothetical protein
MREIRQSGSEGGAMQTNASFLPLSEKQALLDPGFRRGDGFVKNPKSADLSLQAKRSNLITIRISRRLPRRFAPRNDAGGLFTKPSNLPFSFS